MSVEWATQRGLDAAGSSRQLTRLGAVVKYTSTLRFRRRSLQFLDVVTLSPAAREDSALRATPQWKSPTGHECWSKAVGALTTVGLRLCPPFEDGSLVHVGFVDSAGGYSFETMAVMREFGDFSVCKFDVASSLIDRAATVVVALATLETTDRLVVELLESSIDRAATPEDSRAWLLWGESQLRRPTIAPPVSASLMAACWRSNDRVRAGAPGRGPVIAADGGAHEPSPWPTDPRTDIAWLLEQSGALETGFDYELPSGLHAGVHVNAARLCESELHLQAVARSIGVLVKTLEFDTVVAVGWQMSTIARRLIREHRRDLETTLLSVEGYKHITWRQPPQSRARALVLMDVVVTGRLNRLIELSLEGFGAKRVATVALVDARADLDDLRTKGLARVDLGIRAANDCDRCERLPRNEFNPISCSMTTKGPSRTPSEFLKSHPDASEFWSAVNKSNAYEHHRVEGGRHYTSFINTALLVTHPVLGPSLVSKLARQILERSGIPDIIVCPRRERGRLLARELAAALLSRDGLSPQVECVTVGGGLRRYPSDGVAGKRVLIVDSAAGHGDTIDELSLLVFDGGAKSVAAAVVVSRLPESQEEAFGKRLSAFVRLYNVPIRPISVPASLRMLCPVCRERDALLDVAYTSGAESVREYALSKLKPHWRRKPSHPIISPLEQLSLESVADGHLLQHCRRSVAAGIAAHALHASMNNGMATLALPEVLDESIPVQSRAAMLRSLPSGVIEWSGRAVLEHVEILLADTANARMSLASVNLMVRGGETQWLRFLSRIVGAVAAAPGAPASLLNELSYYLHRTVGVDGDLRREALDQLQPIRDAGGHAAEIAASLQGTLLMSRASGEKRD